VLLVTLLPLLQAEAPRAQDGIQQPEGSMDGTVMDTPGGDRVGPYGAVEERTRRLLLLSIRSSVDARKFTCRASRLNYTTSRMVQRSIRQIPMVGTLLCEPRDRLFGQQRLRRRAVERRQLLAPRAQDAPPSGPPELESDQKALKFRPDMLCLSEYAPRLELPRVAG